LKGASDALTSSSFRRCNATRDCIEDGMKSMVSLTQRRFRDKAADLRPEVATPRRVIRRMHHLRLGRLQSFERWRGGDGNMRPGRGQQVVVAVPILCGGLSG
jgi:hypothetical protein